MSKFSDFHVELLRMCGEHRVMHNNFRRAVAISTRDAFDASDEERKPIQVEGATYDEAAEEAVRLFAERLRARAKRLNEWSERLLAKLDEPWEE